MGKVQVPGRLSGKSYTINIKGDTPSDTEQARIRQFLEEKEGAFAAEYEATFGRPLQVDDGTALGRGFEQGKAGAYSRLGTATEYLGSGLGIESLEGLGRGMRASGDYEGFLESLRQPAPTTLEDVKNAEGIFPTISKALTYAGEGVGQSIPEMAAPLAAGAAGTLVGGPAGGLTAGAATAFPSFFGGNVQRQEAEVAAGRKDKVDVGAAVISAIGQSALNSIADKFLIGGFLKPGQKWLTRTVVGAGEGAAAEIPSEITQQIIERKQAGLPLDNDEAIDEYVNAGILAGIMGGATRGTTAALNIGNKAATPTDDTAPPADTTTPPAATPPVATSTPPVVATPPVAAPPTASAAPKTSVLTPEASQLDEMKAEYEDKHGYSFDELQAMHDKIDTADDKIGAITQLAAELEVSPDVATELYNDVRGVLNYAKTKAAAPVGQPTVRGKAPKTPKGAKAPTAPRFTGPITDAEYKALSDEDKQTYVNEIGMPPVPEAPKATVTLAPTTGTGLQIQGVDEAVASGVSKLKVVEDGKEVPFKNFALSVDGDTAEVGFVERDKSARKGVGYDAYVALGEDLTARGITLQSTETLQAPGRALWEKLAKQGKATFDPTTKRFKFSAAPEATPAPEAKFSHPEGAPFTRPLTEEEFQTLSDNDKARYQADPNMPPTQAMQTPADAKRPSRTAREISDSLGVTDEIKRLSALGLTPNQIQQKLSEQGSLKEVPEAGRSKFVQAAQTELGISPQLTEIKTTPAIWANKDFDIPVELMPEPAQVDEKTGEKYQKVRQQDGNISFAPVSQLRPASAPKPQGDVDVSTYNAVGEGRVTNTAGQAIPEPVQVAQATREAPKPEDAGKTPEQLEAERAAAAKEVADNAAAQEKLDARWKAWVAANPELRDIVEDNYTPAGKNAQGITIGRDPTSSADKQAILDLLDRSASSMDSAKEAGARYAKNYFKKVPNPGEAMDMMAYDAVYSPTTKYTTPPDMKGTPEAVYLQGTGRNQAAAAIEWVQANLTPKSAAYVAEETALNQRLLKAELENTKKKKDRVQSDRKYLYGRKTPEEIAALEELRKADLIAYDREVEAQRQKAATAVEERKNAAETQAGRKPTLPTPPWAKLLGLDSRIGLGLPMHPLAKQALARGDLRTALNVIAATTPNPRLSRIAEKLALKVGNTKVQVVSGLTNHKGQPIRGAFDPKINTIMLDAENGMDVHTALHEMVHATTVQTLANTAHPLTKRLEKLYDNVKDVLANTYGGTSLEEFTSEASSNPEFQAMLEQLQERGTKVTAWSRFKNVVGNFLRGMIGLPPVQPNALDAASSLIDAILDPAPDTSNLGPLYMAANNPTEARKALSAALRNGREPTKANLRDAGARVVEGGSGLSRMVMKGLMQITPLHLLVQQAQKFFPSASKLNDLVNEASGAFSRARDTLQAFTTPLQKYMRKATAAQRENWNTVAHDITYYEVEPWLSNAEATMRYGKGDDVMGKLKQYDRLKALWDAMDPEGQRQIRTAVNFFKKLRNDALDSAEMSLAALFPGDPATKDAIWKSFKARLLAKGTIEPYLPLFREGDYVLTFNAFNPDTNTTEVYSHRFMTARERADYRAQIEPAVIASLVESKIVNDTGEAVTRMDMREAVGRRNVNYSNVPPQSFVGQLMAKMVQKKVDPDVIRAITEVVIDTLPETAYAKAFKSRTGVLGATAHMDRAIIERATSLSRQQVQATYRGAFSRIKTDLAKEYDDNPATRNSLDARDMLDQLQAIADFGANPTRSKVARVAMSTGFMYTLGFNPSSALLNFFQLPGIVLPYLSGKYDLKPTLAAMREARQLLAGSGRTRVVDVVTDKLDAAGKPIVEQKRVSAAYSIINYDFDAANMDARTKRLKFLVEEGEKLGQFNRSQVYDILDLDGADGLGTKLSAAAGFMMHHSERMVREVTLASAYQLEVDRMVKANKGQPLTEADYREAAKEAIRFTEDTNGGIAAGAAPRIAQTGLGAAVFMYKRFAVTMYGLMIKTAHQAIKGQSKEARKIAQYQLAGIFGATGMLAGVAGMPLYGALAAVFNLFRDDEEEDFQTLTRSYLGDGVYRGLVNHLTGINIATRIGLSDLLFRDNLVEKDQSALWTLIEQVGGPVVGTALNVERGMSLWSEGEYMRGFENMIPAALRAPVRAFRFATQGAETMDGKPIIEDLSPVEIAAQALGFNPARYQNQLESNAKKKKFERAVLERRNKLLDNYFYAYFNGDTETMQDVAEDIYDFGTDYPELAITSETLRNSQRQRTRSRENAYHGVTFNEKLRARAEAFGGIT